MAEKIGPFQVDYFVNGNLSHSYQETWERVDDCFCPNCGVKAVWVEDSEGDYYHGPTYLCSSCGAQGCCWGSGPSQNEQHLQRLKVIREQRKS